MDGHSSGMRIAAHLARPTRTAIRKPITCRPYLVLLPVGLALPPLLPEARCALTAPFQPCRGQSSEEDRAGRRCHFCGAIPGVAPAGRYPAPSFRGARTSLDPLGRPAVTRPSDTLELRHSPPASNAQRCAARAGNPVYFDGFF